MDLRKQIHINLFNQYSETLNSRAEAKNLFKYLKAIKETRIVLDFDKITFISRSFADQLIKEKREQKNLTIIFSNLNKDLQKMLRIVERTQNKKNREYYQIPILSFTDKENLKDYLLSI